MKSMKALLESFLQPPLSLRGAPFWSWNDRLETAELTRQVSDMKAHGMGGFFMHAREGLETVYMSEDWLDCIRTTVKKASETGMNAWLYDEDRWPSGFAGGLVPARGGDAFRNKGVQMTVTPDFPAADTFPIAVFRARVDGQKLLTAQRVEAPVALAPDETYLVFQRIVLGPTEWFNDDAYADNLNPDSVAAFIDITYEKYRQEVGSEFGKAIPGIFTDEPNIFNFNFKNDEPVLPWTDCLPEFFRKQRGYDLIGVLPWLFFDGDESSDTAPSARHDYWHTISELFTGSYSKQLGEWCEKNGLAFTGHYLFENDMGNAIIRGGAIMPHYRWQQVPGIDMLTEQNFEFCTIKQCSSVANQFNRKRLLSETYGCSGWEFTFEGQKWNGDWQYVLGVNLRCQHLALYSLRGCRKRDYPPSFNYNTTWWKDNGVVEDYFARVGAITTAGQAVRDVLLLHPIATGWTKFRMGPGGIDEVNEYGYRLNDFVQLLLATHYDFDFGDEQIMAADTQVGPGTIQVGRAPYRVVVIPPETQTLMASTVDLLESFLDKGGKVVAFGPMPEWISGHASERLAELWKKPGVTVLSDPAQLNAALESLCPRRISLQTQYGQEAARLLYMERETEDGQAFFIVNNDRHASYSVNVALEGGDGLLEEWDPLTGAVHPVQAVLKDGKLHFRADFGPAGSRIYVYDRTRRPETTGLPAEPSKAYLWHDVFEDAIGPVLPFTRTDPNVLTLDMCRCRLNGEAWSDVMQVWEAQNAARQALGMRPNYYNGLPQRYRWAFKGHPKDGTPLEMRFIFQVLDVPQTPVHLVIEGAEQFTIKLNGQTVSSKPDGWYLDHAFHTVALPQLCPGENVLDLACAYTNHMEIEDCFICGDFGVSLEREITAEPARLHLGSWTDQGYPHYPGGMIYHAHYECAQVKPTRLVLGDYDAVNVTITVNDQLAGHIPWRSVNGLEITPFLAVGDNRIDIEVMGSPRNMLGPLHRRPEHERWTGWDAFRRTGVRYTNDYVFWPWGLFGHVMIEGKGE
jgi:hypothetical protein